MLVSHNFNSLKFQESHSAKMKKMARTGFEPVNLMDERLKLTRLTTSLPYLIS